MLKRILKALNLAGGEEVAPVGRDPLKVMCNRISRFKDHLVTPDDAPAYVEALIAEAKRDAGYADEPGLRATAGFTRTISAACARRTPRISATCCSGPRVPC